MSAKPRSPRPEPKDWLLVLCAARSVLREFELDSATATLDDLEAEIELRQSLARVAEHVGVPVTLLEITLDPEHLGQ